MKFDVTKIEYYPKNNCYHVKLMTWEERIAKDVFHSLIMKTPTIIIEPNDKQGGYTVEIPDDFFETLNKQKKGYEELESENPSTRVYKTTG